MSDRFGRITDAVLVVAALAVVGIYAKREFGSPQATPRRSEPMEYIEDWTAVLNDGVWMGSRDADVKIVEFADLECPACRRFRSTLNEAVKAHGDRVAVVFVHFPLSQHRFAEPAARALECADQQSRAASFADVVYNTQDSLGLLPWSELGRRAGIDELAEFGNCVARTDSFPRIAAGKDWGAKLGVRGTPTVLVNGWRTSASAETIAAVDSVIRGKSPYRSGQKRRLLAAK